MAADAVGFPIGLDDHGHGVPADDRLDTPFQGAITGEWGLVLGGDRIYIRCLRGDGKWYAGLLGLDLELLQQAADARRAA